MKNNKRIEFNKKKKHITQLKFVHPKQTKHQKNSHDSSKKTDYT